jgi:hypothetical protein
MPSVYFYVIVAAQKATVKSSGANQGGIFNFEAVYTEYKVNAKVSSFC